MELSLRAVTQICVYRYIEVDYGSFSQRLWLGVCKVNLTITRWLKSQAQAPADLLHVAYHKASQLGVVAMEMSNLLQVELWLVGDETSAIT